MLIYVRTFIIRKLCFFFPRVRTFTIENKVVKKIPLNGLLTRVKPEEFAFTFEKKKTISNQAMDGSMVSKKKTMTFVSKL